MKHTAIILLSILLVAVSVDAASPPADEKIREVDYRNIKMPSENVSASLIRATYEAMKGKARPASSQHSFIKTEQDALSWGLVKNSFSTTNFDVGVIFEVWQTKLGANERQRIAGRLNNIGLAMALADYFYLSDQTDNSGAREFGLMKDMISYVAGVVSERWDWNSLGRGMLVVAAVDMKLNKIGNDSVAWQHRNWQMAFDNYHSPGRGGRKAGPGYIPPKKWIEMFEKSKFNSPQDACNYLRSHFMSFWDKWESDPSFVIGYTDQRKQVNNGIFDNLLNALTRQGAMSNDFRTPRAKKTIKSIVDKHIRDSYGPILYYYSTNTLPKRHRTEARKRAAAEMNRLIRESGINEETEVHIAIRCNDDLGARGIRIGPWTKDLGTDTNEKMEFTRLSLTKYGGEDPLENISLLFRVKGDSKVHTITQPIQSLWKTMRQNVQFDLSGLIALRVRMVNSITGDPVGGTVRATLDTKSLTGQTSGSRPAYLGTVNLDAVSNIGISAMAAEHHPMKLYLGANNLRNRGNGLVVVRVEPINPEPWLAIKQRREEEIRRRQMEEERRRRLEEERRRREEEIARNREREQENYDNRQDQLSNAKNREELRRNYQRQLSSLYSEMERLMNAQAKKVHDTILSRTPPGYPDPCGGNCTGKYVTLDGMEEWRIKCARCGRGRGTTSSYTKMGKSADQIKAEYTRRIRSLEASYKAQMKRMGG